MRGAARLTSQTCVPQRLREGEAVLEKGEEVAGVNVCCGLQDVLSGAPESDCVRFLQVEGSPSMPAEKAPADLFDQQGLPVWHWVWQGQ